MIAAPASSRSSLLLYAVFIGIVVVNVGFWLHARAILPKWDNVPPAPKTETIAFTGLGDKEIAYRLTGYFLQNLGNTGGNFEPLKMYDYGLLEKWFLATQELDPRSNYIPFLAAYYFGAVDEEPDKVKHVIDYLAVAGQEPYPQKWRWLAQAVYLARYSEKNLDKALKLANILASLKTDTAPWAKQMPAFIQLEMGNKEASYQIMINMLITEQDKMDPAEVNFMRDFICTRTLPAEEVAKMPLCHDVP